MSDRPFGSDRPFDLAFIGAGTVVEHRHLPGLARTGQGRAVSVFDPNETQAHKVAEAFQIPHVASSLEGAIATDGVEAVVIASPNLFHRGAVEAAGRPASTSFAISRSRRTCATPAPSATRRKRPAWCYS